MSHCQNMLKIISSENGDVHGDTAKLLFGIDETHPRWKQMRTVAKRLNFGMLYGAGANKLQTLIVSESGLEVTKGNVEDMLARYNNNFPEFKRFYKRAEKAAERRGWISLMNGKVRPFAPGEETFKAFNAIIQGNVAQSVARWMVEIERLWPGILLLQIHDSVVIEIDRPEIAESVRWLGVELMQKAFKVPFQIDSKRWE
jgi:DNA polymerase-1